MKVSALISASFRSISSLESIEQAGQAGVADLEGNLTTLGG